MTAQTTLYETIGGAAAVTAAVEEFYRRVLADGALAPYFADVDIGELKKHQHAFLTMALNGPGHYGGRPLQQAHARHHITNADFDAVAGHLYATLTSLGVPETQIGTIMGKIAPLREDIVSVNDGA